MARRKASLAVVLTVGLMMGLTAGCAADSDVDDVEEMLAERYLDPLAAAGVTTSVERSCRYAGAVDGPWHLSISLRLAAGQQRVADILDEEGMVVRRDREPMIVQQVPGDPGAGWNGSLATAGDAAELVLVFHNAAHDGWPDAVGWAEVCPAAASGV